MTVTRQPYPASESDARVSHVVRLATLCHDPGGLRPLFLSLHVNGARALQAIPATLPLNVSSAARVCIYIWVTAQVRCCNQPRILVQGN